MAKFSLDEKQLKHFVTSRQNFQLLTIVPFGALIMLKIFEYDYSNKPAGFLMIFSFVILGWLGIVLLLKKFKSTIHAFYEWDKDIVVTIIDHKVIIESKQAIKEYELREIRVRNHVFYGRRAISYNPLNGLGFVEIESNNEVIRISNIVFDMGGGFYEIKRIFQNDVSSYAEFTLSWFKKV